MTCSKVASTGQPLAEAPSGDPRLLANFFFENPTQVQDGEVAKPLPPGNHSADPKVAGAGDNFRLAADSPARVANAGAADPIAFASPFPILPEETSIIPDLDTRDYSKWKKSAWRVFGGDTEKIHIASLNEPCGREGLGISNEVLARRFRMRFVTCA